MVKQHVNASKKFQLDSPFAQVGGGPLQVPSFRQVLVFSPLRAYPVFTSVYNHSTHWSVARGSTTVGNDLSIVRWYQVRAGDHWRSGYEDEESVSVDLVMTCSDQTRLTCHCRLMGSYRVT